MIKNIVFDMGNVIIRWDPKHIVNQYTNDKDEQRMFLKEVFGSREWLAYDEGTMSKQEVQDGICSRLNAKYHQQACDMVSYWYRDCPPIKEMEPIIKELKDKGYSIYLLSNTNTSFDEYKDTIPVFMYFDGFYISANYKLVKPSKEIFEDFSRRFDVSLSECVFIDDIPINVEGAIAAGMEGYCFNKGIEHFKEYLKKESF